MIKKRAKIEDTRYTQDTRTAAGKIRAPLSCPYPAGQTFFENFESKKSPELE